MTEKHDSTFSNSDSYVPDFGTVYTTFRFITQEWHADQHVNVLTRYCACSVVVTRQAPEIVMSDLIKRKRTEMD